LLADFEKKEIVFKRTHWDQGPQTYEEALTIRTNKYRQKDQNLYYKHLKRINVSKKKLTLADELLELNEQKTSDDDISSVVLKETKRKRRKKSVSDIPVASSSSGSNNNENITSTSCSSADVFSPPTYVKSHLAISDGIGCK
jgi:hypothetical protein